MLYFFLSSLVDFDEAKYDKDLGAMKGNNSKIKTGNLSTKNRKLLKYKMTKKTFVFWNCFRVPDAKGV